MNHQLVQSTVTVADTASWCRQRALHPLPLWVGQAEVRHGKSKGDGLKNNTKESKKTCRKQQQESLPACERTDKLETRENCYHPGQSMEIEQDILKRWTEYCSDFVCTHNNRRSQGARCPSTNQQWQLPYPAGRSWSRNKITEERQVGRRGQNSTGAGPGRRRGYDRHVTHHLQQDLADRKVANTLDSVPDHHSPKERKPTTMPKLPYHQPDQSSQ